MGNGRERETFMEEKELLHYPKWIDAIKEEEEYTFTSVLFVTTHVLQFILLRIITILVIY